MTPIGAGPATAAIDEFVTNIPGWTPADQLHTLFTMVLATSGQRGDVLELGSWCGRSTAAMGFAAKLCGNTRVFSIDLFPEKDDWHQNEDGSYSMTVTINGSVVRAYQHQTVWKEPFERDIAPLYATHNGIVKIFQESIERYGLEGTVTAHKGTLATFLQGEGRGLEFRLAFIDGDHGYDAVCDDIRRADGVLVPGGWICLDDAFTSYAGVNRAIDELIIDNPRYELAQQMTRKLFVARKRSSTWAAVRP